MAENIRLPDGTNAPLWATEDTMKSLLKAMTGKSSSKGTSDIDEDAPVRLNKQFKSMADAIGNLTGNKGMGALAHNAGKIAESFGGERGGLATGLSNIGTGLGYAAEAAGAFAPAVQGASIMITAYANLMGDYLKVLGQAIDSGLGFSSSLGASAAIAGQAGVSVSDFYHALSASGATYRALGDNAMDAAKNFGALQSSVRSTYGTFGLSNEAMATASADYVKLVAASGARGQAATDQAAAAFGGTMEQMRQISMATGVSMSSLQGSMKDLIASPMIMAGISKFGATTEEATIKLAKGAAGFEAVFGKLGKDLYKQMVEAEAAGLSIINTELGSQMAAFTDLGAMTKFNKMMQDGSGTAAEMAEAQRAFLQSTEANLPTLQMLAATGDSASRSLIEMYNSAKSAKIMSQEELDALQSKKRAEEQLMNVQNNIGAAYSRLTSKLYGFLDAIPISVFETLGTVLGGAIDAVGFLVDGISSGIKLIWSAFSFVGDGIMSTVGAVVDIFKQYAVVFESMGIAAGLVATFMTAQLIPAMAASVYTTLTEVIPAMAASAMTMISSFVPTVLASAMSLGAGLLGAAASAWAMAAPMLPIIAGFVALSAGVYLVITHFDEISEAANNLWKSFTDVFNAIGDWFKNSWIGKALGGAGGTTSSPMGESGSSIMDSVAQNTAGPVKTATTNVIAAKVETANQASSQNSEHLEKIADLTEKSLKHQSDVAKNTASTVDAVNSGNTNY